MRDSLQNTDLLTVSVKCVNCATAFLVCVDVLLTFHKWPGGGFVLLWVTHPKRGGFSLFLFRLSGKLPHSRCHRRS